ncbi:MAG: hypothetical protein ACT4PM_14545 [Gemmatimonadales bacterium]
MSTTSPKRLAYTTIRDTKAYDAFASALYLKTRPTPEEITIPPIRVISMTGNDPPASEQFQDAIAVLYGIGYGLKMGLKFRKLPLPKGYFDYRVGALEGIWCSDDRRAAWVRGRPRPRDHRAPPRDLPQRSTADQTRDTENGDSLSGGKAVTNRFTGRSVS